jgi:hypothetical protein
VRRLQEKLQDFLFDFLALQLVIGDAANEVHGHMYLFVVPLFKCLGMQ